RRTLLLRVGVFAGSVVTVAGSVLLPAARPAGADPLATARAQAAQVNAQLQADAARLDSLSQQYELALQHVQQIQGQIDQTKAAIAQDQAQVSADQASLRDAALRAYMAGTTDAGLD